MALFRKKYKDKTGRMRTARYWTLEYYQGGRRIRVALGVTNRRAAKLKAADLLLAREFKSAGVETHEMTRAAPLADLIAEYVEELRRRGRSKNHIKQVNARLGAVLRGIDRLEDVTTERIRAALGRLKAERNHAALTTNSHRMAVHGLFVWLVQEGRWQSNPVKAVKPVRWLGPAMRRRALMEDELHSLIAANPKRAALYLTAATTGLRRNELATLTIEDVDIEGGSVTVRARNAKNRREEVIPLPAVTATALAAHLALRPKVPGTRVFTGTPDIQYYRADLAKAGIEHRVGDEKVDFHSLRVTYATMLARSGVPLALAQKLMRHSDPKLTAVVYTKFELHDRHAAASKLHARLTPKPEDRAADSA